MITVIFGTILDYCIETEMEHGKIRIAFQAILSGRQLISNKLHLVSFVHFIFN